MFCQPLPNPTKARKTYVQGQTVPLLEGTVYNITCSDEKFFFNYSMVDVNAMILECTEFGLVDIKLHFLTN